MKLIADASQKIVERLTWCTAARDQAGIASDLADKKEISKSTVLERRDSSTSFSASWKSLES